MHRNISLVQTRRQGSYELPIHDLAFIHRRCYVTSKKSHAKSLIMLIVLGFFWSMLSGVSGIVLDEQSKPLGGVSITDKRKVVTSSEDGRFSIQTSADSLHISRLGYHPQTVSVKTLQSPIILKADQITLPTVWVRAIEYKTISPSLGAMIIYPDTNEKAQSANELLLQNSSLYTTDTKLAGERQTISILGSFSRHSLVMIDGVVMNSSGEAFDFGTVPISQISHIEIIKGNASVYGGSAAIGGIIHIHTKNAVNTSTWDAEISNTLGSFGTSKQIYSAAVKSRYASARFEYSHHAAQNDFAYDTPDFWSIEQQLKRHHNRKVADTFFAKTSYFKGAVQVDYSINMGSFIRQLPGPINFLELYDDSRLTGNYLQQNIRGAFSKGVLSQEMQLWWNTDHSTYKNLNPSNSFGRNHYAQEQANKGLKLSNNVNVANTKMSLNTEYTRLDFAYKNYLSNTSTDGKRESTALALMARQDLYPAFMKYEMSGAVRGDYSEGDWHPTWRVENQLSIPLGAELVLGGYIGSAFSQPSMFDMYWIGDSETQGNPDLKSENSLGYSLYAAVDYSRVMTKVSYYQNWVDNLIQWRQYYMNGVTWKPFNVGKADIQNLEVESHLQLTTSIGLNAAITFTKAKDISTLDDGSHASSYGSYLVYTPRQKGSITLAYATEASGLSLRYSHTGEQYTTVDNLIAPLPSFDNLDGAAYYKLQLKGLTMQGDFKLNNILNKRYNIYAYIPQPGINWTLGLSVSTKGTWF